MVTAVNAIGESGNSNQASATPTAPPAAPTNPAATSGYGKVDLSWTASSGATGYKVKRATASGGPYTQIATPTTTTYSDSSVVNGTAYYYVVSATNSGGESANSSQVSGTPLAPTAPTNLTATAGNAQVSLSWTAATGATSYKVKRGTVSGGPYSLIASPTGTSYTDTGVSNGTTYYYVVAGANSGGEGPPSNQASATPVYPPPGAPAAPSYSNLQVDAVRVTAPSLPANATSMRLEGKVSGGPSYSVIESGLLGGAISEVIGLDSGITYTFRYVAVGDGGETVGTPADVTIPTQSITWSAGNAISCGGIRYPANGAPISAGAQGRLSAFLATDWDGRTVTLNTNPATTTSGNYSDPCSYTWSASGGSFLNGISSGQSVIWIAPTTPGTYTIYLVVDDQNTLNKPSADGGTRNDASKGYNEDPVRFQISVTVQ